MLSAVSLRPVVYTLPSSQRLSQARMVGGVKPITPTLSETGAVAPPGMVAVNVRFSSVYGVNKVLPVLLLTTLANTCGNAGPAQRVCATGAGRGSTSRVWPVTWLK